jgi:hypothetical protein
MNNQGRSATLTFRKQVAEADYRLSRENLIASVRLEPSGARWVGVGWSISMSISEQDVSRLSELIEEGYRVGDSPEQTFRRIARELPHLSESDVTEFVFTQIDEKKRIEAAKLDMHLEAVSQLAEIIVETERLAGTTVTNLDTALPILVSRVQQGDKEAVKLIEKYNRAALLMSMVGDIPGVVRNS